MKKTMRISLRAGERIFINGAVLRAERKATFELLNDATFLMESHVLQVEQTTTPLRQLYFTVQAMLIDPRNADKARALFDEMIEPLLAAFKNETIRNELQEICKLVANGRTFEALRVIRSLYPLEEAILEGDLDRASKVA
ncbi:flagellar protein FlbT [Pseudoxanthobacter soli DSM 19599]|uniref:Probable flagellum biosynthesis repressor protein FlbT n=1 Tax=Pseudoxanthobacter soli DSM 19599 TaxID=1123029 RepID=A0A1M7ZEB6_9HYPH|nr:flagellar biosynthesis repressor FlbT [Pseudoxanthobacter soli]SHO63214.1 flagellar protein FlbT [Pseudoxanthobacter soli DSM 19599]